MIINFVYICLSSPVHLLFCKTMLKKKCNKGFPQLFISVDINHFYLV